MPPTWDQDFDFYMATRGGIPWLVSLDLAASDHLPVHEHPRLVDLAVPMRRPRDDGLRSAEESEALTELQELLVERLGAELDAVYWGKEIGEGRTVFRFHAPVLDDDEMIRVAQELATDEYPIELAVADDPGWSAYRAALPGPFHRQTMQNRHIQIELEAQGDRLSRPRRVDHLAVFPDRARAETAAADLGGIGFRPDGLAEAEDGSGSVALAFHRRERCDGMRPDETTIEILDRIEPHDGVYDGWGCAVSLPWWRRRG